MHKFLPDFVNMHAVPLLALNPGDTTGGGYYVFTMFRCPVPTWTHLQSGQVHYIHAAAEASYDCAFLSSVVK